MTHEQIMIQMLRRKTALASEHDQIEKSSDKPVVSDWIHTKIIQVKENLSQDFH